jgi:hypothetical protein
MDPVETSQLLRIGASFNEQFQFGLGVDIQKKWISRTVDFNFGPFLRYTF